MRFFLVLLATAFFGSVNAQVVINEVCAAASDRNLQWSADGTPRLGTGISWNARTFSDAGWPNGGLPAGWGYTVSTNLQTAMQNKTPSLYLRKQFTATAAQAAMTSPLVLQVQCDDGFVAYVNGVEVARSNAGPPKHFLYASQQAYNAATSTSIAEVTLGPANTLLVAGSNVLSIQAHNRLLSSNFRINAGLKIVTSTANVTLTKAFYDMDNANGAARTHTNTNGAVTNTASGTPVAGGWLATAADPTSDNTWTSLQIVTAEQQGNGVGGSGGIRYSVAQTGTNRGVVLHAPQVSMTNAWSPGAISAAALAATTLKFRYRTTGDLLFGFRLDPALNLAASSVDGFPVVGLPVGGAADYHWNTATGGFRRRTISAAGVGSDQVSGSIDGSNYEILNGPGTRSGVLTAKEDNAAGIGPGGSTGVFSFTFDTMPAPVDTLSFGIKNITMSEWSPPNITAVDFQRSRFSFRWKLPVGRAFAFYLEPNTGGTASNRAGLGTFQGTGNWETFSVSLSDTQNEAVLRAKLNSQGASGKIVKLTGAFAGISFNDGEQVLLDDVALYYEQPGVQVVENAPATFGDVSGGVRTRTIDAAGTASDSSSGTLVTAAGLFSDPAATGFSFRVVEDNTLDGGNNGTTGFLRCEVTDPPDAGAPWGFSLSGLKVRNWTAGAISVAQLSDTLVQVAVKIPAGITVQLSAEPVGGSTSNRANLGILTGNGTWQIVNRELATAGNVEAFRIALNTASTTSFQLTFAGPTNAPLGEIIAVDDVGIQLWRSYEVMLSQGANQQRFLDYLNQNSRITFVPTFVKTNAPAVGGGSLSLDNFEVTYSGPDPNAFQNLAPFGAAGGLWKYFVGLAEPSGGLFDPALVQSGFPAPLGQEGDYDNPQAFRDWVELRNLGANPVDLSNWSLTDDNGNPAKWKFPAGTTIPANGYRIVMCDDRNEANGVATYLHTNFFLSASGETVGLYNPAGILQSEVNSVPDQDSFHTWGRNPSGAAEYGFLDTGTPGAANAGNFFPSRVRTPDFYKADGVTPLPGGFYSSAQTLILKSETGGATIRYSTDGSEPTETTGTLYTGPIALAAPGDGKSGRVIRARAFLNGLLPSKTKAHSYLIGLDSRLKSVPALLFSGDAGRMFYLPAGVMAINGGTYPGEIWVPNGPDSYNIPFNTGDPYERPITAEWYYPDGRDGWRENVGVRISSSPYSRPRLKLTQTNLSPWTSDHVQKPSFNLYWRGDYGNSEVQDSNLIPGNGVDNYARLRIRAGKNDIFNPFIIDEVARRLYHDMGWVEPTGTINTLYVNGSFKGMFNTTERLREETFQAHYRSAYEFDVRYIGEQVDGDSTFWNQMQTALNQSQAALANYQNVKNYLDVTNIADCFLFWIYINMDDWPTNNWAAQRERSPAGRYRMVAWDLEAAFGRFGKAVSYNTLDTKLLNASSECGDIFKRLYASPEFKLLFADRVNKHMFNGGVLDDRAANSRFRLVKDQFKALVLPVLSYLGSPTLEENWYNVHVNATTGRRAYLFGTAPGAFPTRGLWPATQPATFSQFGGVVPSGYQLTISKTAPADSTIYYTLDGSDPRLTGGAVSPSALIYTGPVTLNNLVAIHARVKNSNGEWSPLTEAFFEPSAAPPTPGNLVISEIMYHPPSPSAAEEALTFTDGDEFEFIRLTNVGAGPLDLRNLRFTVGITYDFSQGNVLAINSGASVLVVKNLDAFHARYGIGYDSMIAGEYAGGLSNGGELITLQRTGASPVTIQSFAFGDSNPWPQTPDGYGPSLMLSDPASAPSPADPANWSACAQPGGMPGGAPRTLSYAVWRKLVFNSTDASNPAVSGPNVDVEGDGLSNVAEYALGSVPTFPDAASAVSFPVIENVGGQNYLTLQYRLMSGASEATVTSEVSGDLATWSSGAASVIPVSGPTADSTGFVSWTVRDATSILAGERAIRLKVVGP